MESLTAWSLARLECEPPHLETLDMLLKHGAEPSLIDKEGNTVDATAIVQAYRTLGGKDDEGAEGGKDEL